METAMMRYDEVDAENRSLRAAKYELETKVMRFSTAPLIKNSAREFDCRRSPCSLLHTGACGATYRRPQAVTSHAPGEVCIRSQPCVMQVTELEHRLRAAEGGHAVAQEELARLRSAAQVLRNSGLQLVREMMFDDCMIAHENMRR